MWHDSLSYGVISRCDDEWNDSYVCDSTHSYVISGTWISPSWHTATLQHTVTHAATHTATHTATHAAPYSGTLISPSRKALCNTLQLTATHCNMLYNTHTHSPELESLHCDTLQHCNTLQHTLHHTLHHTPEHESLLCASHMHATQLIDKWNHSFICDMTHLCVT